MVVCLFVCFLIRSFEVGRSFLNWNHLESEEPSKSEPYLLVAVHLRWHRTGKLWLFAWMLSLCQVLLSCFWDIPSSVLEPTSSGCQWKTSSCLGIPWNTRSRSGLTRQPVSWTKPLPDQLSESQRAFLMGDSHCRIPRPQPVSHSNRLHIFFLSALLLYSTPTNVLGKASSVHSLAISALIESSWMVHPIGFCFQSAVMGCFDWSLWRKSNSMDAYLERAVSLIAF